MLFKKTFRKIHDVVDEGSKLVGIINPPVIKPFQECHVETLTNGDIIVTVYGDTTNCETYTLGGK